MDSFAERLGHRIRVMRAEKRLTQGDLASKAGVCLSSVTAWERGESAISFENANKVAVALGTTPNDLCGIGREP